VVRKAFLDQHPDLVSKFIEAHLDTIDYIKANQDDAKATVNKEIARLTGKALPKNVVDKAFTTTDITYDPLAKTLLKSADDAFALGFLGNTKPDLSGLYELKPLNDALTARKLETVTGP
jgi:NitT/TauT family transport system substrate-binding protein